MSFGGSVSAMVTSLKNNRRKRVSAFKRMKEYGDVKYKEWKIEKKATPALLKQIRDKVQKQQRRETAIIYAFIAIGVVIFLWVFLK